jgi:hypothetical protein
VGKKDNRVKDAPTKMEREAAAAQLAEETKLSSRAPGVNRTLGEAIDEAEREFNVRERCFPKWIQEGRITKTDAKDRLERLGAACYFLRALLAGDVESCLEAMGKSQPPSPEPEEA